MKIEQVADSLFCITPDEGKHLTQAVLENEDDRVFCCSAYELAEADASKWRECTEEDRCEYERRHEGSDNEEADDTVN